MWELGGSEGIPTPGSELPLCLSHTHSNHLKGPYLLTSNSWEYCEFGRQDPRSHSLQGLGILDFHPNSPMLLMAKQAQRQEPEAGRSPGPPSGSRSRSPCSLRKVPAASQRKHTSAVKEEGRDRDLAAGRPEF